MYFPNFIQIFLKLVSPFSLPQGYLNALPLVPFLFTRWLFYYYNVKALFLLVTWLLSLHFCISDTHIFVVAFLSPPQLSFLLIHSSHISLSFFVYNTRFRLSSEIRGRETTTCTCFKMLPAEWVKRQTFVEIMSRDTNQAAIRCNLCSLLLLLLVTSLSNKSIFIYGTTNPTQLYFLLS